MYAGPPPPRSWVSSRGSDAHDNGRASQFLRLTSTDLAETSLPGAYIPEKGSLIDIVLHKLAYDWDFQREYNQFYLYFLPNHLKPALIRRIGIRSSHGVSISDLKLILLPPVDIYKDGELDTHALVNQEMTSLDLAGSLGRPIILKEVIDLLYPPVQAAEFEEPEDSWDAVESSPSPPRVLLPNLSHLSLALDPEDSSVASWKQLLTLSSKASRITHLSLAYWPVPCFNPRARISTVSSPQGQRVAYGGTNYYSHSLDNDWSEALLILRMLSRNLYELEYLDLTGCESWFKALSMNSEHDFIDWAGNWGKITHLKLCAGWKPAENSPTSEQAAYVDIAEDAAKVEKHIRTMRAGKGRFVTVDRAKEAM